VEVADPDGNLQSADFYLMDPDTTDGTGNSIASQSFTPQELGDLSRTTVTASLDSTNNLDQYRILVRVTDSSDLRNSDSFTVAGSGDDGEDGD
jgi:hypothetical protein